MNKYIEKIAQMEMEKEASGLLTLSSIIGTRAAATKWPHLVPGYTSKASQAAVAGVRGAPKPDIGHIGHAIHTSALPTTGTRISEGYEAGVKARGGRRVSELSFGEKRKMLRDIRGKIGDPAFKEFKSTRKTATLPETSQVGGRAKLVYNAIGAAGDVATHNFVTAAERARKPLAKAVPAFRGHKGHVRFSRGDAGEATGNIGTSIASLL